MTPKSQRIAIAQAHLGGKFYFESGTFYRWHTEECPQPFSRLCKEGGWLVRVELPDYLNSLDAMQSAVLYQDQRFQEQFACRLAEMRTAKRKMHHQLTANDWAEVFVGLLNAK